MPDTNFTFEYRKPERSCLCEFSLETRIDDVSLPGRIAERLAALELRPAPEKSYVVDVSFSAAIYQDAAFYQFPVERKPWQIDRLQAQKPKEQALTILDDVISQQLHNICAALAPFGIPYRFAAIAGEDWPELNRVDFCIYENTLSTSAPADGSAKKSRRKPTAVVAYSIIPHRPSTAKRAAELLIKQAIQKAREEQQKELEKSAHTPNLIPAERLFTALAAAILSEQPSEYASPDSLGYELLSQAQLKNDWPLQLVGTCGVFSKENPLTLDNPIDCPELLVFVRHGPHWSLTKSPDLADAKHTILRCGYNQKSVEQVIVLRNLAPVPFELFREENGEIIPIAKAAAHTAKRLLLRWGEVGK